jgi:hypothetical protein
VCPAGALKSYALQLEANPDLERHDLSRLSSEAPHALCCVYPHESTAWAFALTVHYLRATDRSTDETPIRGILAAAPRFRRTNTSGTLGASSLSAFALRVGYTHDAHAFDWLASAERLVAEQSVAPDAALARHWIEHVTYRDAQRTLLDARVPDISRADAPRQPSRLDVLRRAAERGDARAAYAWGLAELNGIGTRSRPAEGVRWLEQAAVQGHSEAQYELGTMYCHGWSVPRDPIVALAWLIAAQRGGHDHAHERAMTLTEHMTDHSVARAISTAGAALYGPRQRQEWESRLPPASRHATSKLYAHYDWRLELKKQAEAELIAESKRHPIVRILQTAPGLGPIRVARLLPIVVTPHRFRTKRQFWSYCGLGIVMRSSSDWVRASDGSWQWAQVAKTRGLSRQHNHTLKDTFKGAATSVVQQGEKVPIHADYQRLVESGTKPNLAKLTLARKIAAIVLRMWKDEEVYRPDRRATTTTHAARSTT